MDACRLKLNHGHLEALKLLYIFEVFADDCVVPLDSTPRAFMLNMHRTSSAGRSESGWFNLAY